VHSYNRGRGDEEGGGTVDPWSRGYTDKEVEILKYLYENGGSDAVHGVVYMLLHGIHIQWGEPLLIYAPNPNGDTFSGDWQSEFDVGAWFDDKNVYLAPSVSKENILNDPFALQNIVHEALHIEQGYWLSHSWEGERLAWQTGRRVYAGLGYTDARFEAIASVKDPYNFRSTLLGIDSTLDYAGRMSIFYSPYPWPNPYGFGR
jgi:hypothetical protein